jgi:TldD protein
MTSRRTFIGQITSATVAVAGITATSGIAGALERFPRAGDPLLKDLAAKALDAAKAAGATYADVRFTVTRQQYASAGGPSAWQVWNDEEHGGVGIRALADGAWGFAGANAFSADEVTALAREAVAQARTYARVKRRKVELGATPPMVTGTWATPVKRDPFTLSVAEKLDTMWALGEVISRLDLPLGVTAGGGMYVALRRQEKTFASTDGSFTTQTLHWIEPTFSISARKGRANTRYTYHRVGARAGGWEVMTEPALARDIPEVLELVIQSLDAEAVDPDRYDRKPSHTMS